MLITIHRRLPPVTLSSDGDMGAPSDSDSPSPSASEEEWANDAAEGEPTAPRKSTRNATKKTRELPFSPRRTRTRGKRASTDAEGEEEEAESSDSGAHVRRSTRTRKKPQEVIVVDDEEDYDDYHETTSKGKKKAPRKRKIPRPAYGVIRNISQLNYDSDDNTAPLYAHRRSCDSCKLPIVQPLLDKLRKKPKKGKRKRRSESDDEFEEDEEERLIRLGGWVRW